MVVGQPQFQPNSRSYSGSLGFDKIEVRALKGAFGRESLYGRLGERDFFSVLERLIGLTNSPQNRALVMLPHVFSADPALTAGGCPLHGNGFGQEQEFRLEGVLLWHGDALSWNHGRKARASLQHV